MQMWAPFSAVLLRTQYMKHDQGRTGKATASKKSPADSSSLARKYEVHTKGIKKEKKKNQLYFRSPKVKTPAEEFVSHIPKSNIAFHGLQEQRASFSPKGNEQGSLEAAELP